MSQDFLSRELLLGIRGYFPLGSRAQFHKSDRPSSDHSVPHAPVRGNSRGQNDLLRLKQYTCPLDLGWYAKISRGRNKIKENNQRCITISHLTVALALPLSSISAVMLPLPTCWLAKGRNEPLNALHFSYPYRNE